MWAPGAQVSPARPPPFLPPLCNTSVQQYVTERGYVRFSGKQGVVVRRQQSPNKLRWGLGGGGGKALRCCCSPGSWQRQSTSRHSRRFPKPLCWPTVNVSPSVAGGGTDTLTIHTAGEGGGGGGLVCCALILAWAQISRSANMCGMQRGKICAEQDAQWLDYENDWVELDNGLWDHWIIGLLVEERLLSE